MAGVWSLWSGDKGDVPASLIRPSEAAFRTWRVGTAVNNVRHDAASLLDPV
jgi:putative SOS response-associated peptidase YedK